MELKFEAPYIWECFFRFVFFSPFISKGLVTYFRYSNVQMESRMEYSYFFHLKTCLKNVIIPSWNILKMFQHSSQFHEVLCQTVDTKKVSQWIVIWGRGNRKNKTWYGCRLRACLTAIKMTLSIDEICIVKIESERMLLKSISRWCEVDSAKAKVNMHDKS